MKKLLALLLAVAIACPLGACSSDGEIIEITLPAFIYQDKTEEEIQAEAEEYNCISYAKNEDGTVTYTLTEATHKEIVETIDAEIQNTMTESLDAELGVLGFTAIEYTENYTKFNIYVDADEYTEYMIVYAYSYFVSGVYYQMYTGVDADDIDVLVTFLDDETNETLTSGSYRSLLNAEA